MTRTLNKLRQEPLNTNARSTPLYVSPAPTSRPSTARITTHQNTGTTTTPSVAAAANYYYHPQLSTNPKGPLPAELITRRPTSSFIPNGTSIHSRISTGTGPLIVPQATLPIKTQTRTNETNHARISTPLRAPAKSVDTGLHQIDGFNFDNVTLDDHPGKSKVKQRSL